MTASIKNVLFLCTGNSARSILAEVALQHAGRGRFRAFSAGSRPVGQVNPHALAFLKKSGLPTEGLRSKSWQEFAEAGAPAMDFVFTVCDNAAQETCPVWPGQPISAHWGMPDPASATGSEEDIQKAFAATWTLVNRRIDLFLNLRPESLDALSLTRKLKEIGGIP